MCSIGGWIAEKPLLPALAEQLASALLYYGTVRGQQSAGVYANGRIAKAAKNPKQFIYTPEFRALFNDPVAIGLTHTRQPTCGGRGDEQAQPFSADSGRVVTVHNGMYSDFDKIKKRWDIDKPSGVDSEFVTQYIAKYGIAKLPDFLAEADGSSAIAALVDNKLYLTRVGGQLSIQYIITEDYGRILVFASTAEILALAARFCWMIDTKLGYDLDFNELVEATPEKITALAKINRIYTRTYSGGPGRTTYTTAPESAPKKDDTRRKGNRSREAQSKDFWKEQLQDEGWTERSDGSWAPPGYRLRGQQQALLD